MAIRYVEIRIVLAAPAADDSSRPVSPLAGSMKTQQAPEQDVDRAIERRGWSLFCLLAMIAILVSFGLAEPVQANNVDLPYATATTSIGAGCDADQPIIGGHCCAGATCAAYAQHEIEATAARRAHGSPLRPVIQSSVLGRTVRPSLQPPRA